MSDNLQAAATHLGSQLLYADNEGYLPYLDDIAEHYWDEDFGRIKIEVTPTEEAKKSLLPKWDDAGPILLNEQHFMEALSKVLHPTGVQRNIDRGYFRNILVGDESEYAWMRLDTVDAANVLEIILFGKVIY